MRAARLTIACALLLAACTSGSGGTSPSPAVSATPPEATSGSAVSSPTATAGKVDRAADWPTYHGHPDRSGVSSGMRPVRGTPHVVHALKLDGQVYASPVVLDGIVVVATENNTVYAFNPNLTQRWKRNLGSPSRAGERGCGNIDPLGITGTPVAERATGSVFVSPELGGPPRHLLVALDIRTGAVKWSRSIDLPGVEARAMQERGALTVAGGRVWVPFGGLAGDCGGYKGRLVGVPLNGVGAPTSYTVPTTREGGIWTPPGPSVDAAGNLFVAVGNGEAGQGDPYDFSDSVLKIGADGTLRDSYSPSTWATDNEADLDLGSQGPALVGSRWVFIAGKSGFGYVLRQRALGGIGGEVSRTKLCSSYGGTAVDGDVVYVPCEDGVRAVRIDGSGTMHVRWHASVSGSPVIGGGRVWSLDPDRGTLHSLDPKTGDSLASVLVGATSRFATPALTARDVLIPTLQGITVVRTS